MLVRAEASSAAAGLIILLQGLFYFANQFLHLYYELTFRREPQIFAILNQRTLALIHAQQNVAGEQMCFGEIGLELQRHTDWTTGLRHFTHVPVKSAQRELSVPRLLVELQSFAQCFFGLGITLLAPVDFAQIEQRRCVFWFDLERALKRSFSRSPLLEIHVG